MKSTTGAYEQIHRYLDDDEQIIFPEMYKQNPELYLKVRGVVYMIQNIKTGTVDWVRADSRWVFNPEKDIILRRMLWVTVRTSPEENGFLIAKEEYMKDPSIYVILDVVLTCVHKSLGIGRRLDMASYQKLIHEYDLIDTSFFVTWAYRGGS